MNTQELLDMLDDIGHELENATYEYNPKNDTDIVDMNTADALVSSIEDIIAIANKLKRVADRVARTTFEKTVGPHRGINSSRKTSRRKDSKNKLNCSAADYYGRAWDIYFDYDMLDFIFEIFDGTAAYLTAVADNGYAEVLKEITTRIYTHFGEYTGDGFDLIHELETEVAYDASSMNETSHFPLLLFAIRDYIQKLQKCPYNDEISKIKVDEWNQQLILECCHDYLDECDEFADDEE